MRTCTYSEITSFQNSQVLLNVTQLIQADLEQLYQSRLESFLEAEIISAVSKFQKFPIEIRAPREFDTKNCSELDANRIKIVDSRSYYRVVKHCAKIYKEKQFVVNLIAAVSGKDESGFVNIRELIPADNSEYINFANLEDIYWRISLPAGVRDNRVKIFEVYTD